jgi:hypothetical protein
VVLCTELHFVPHAACIVSQPRLPGYNKARCTPHIGEILCTEDNFTGAAASVSPSSEGNIVKCSTLLRSNDGVGTSTQFMRRSTNVELAARLTQLSQQYLANPRTCKCASARRQVAFTTALRIRRLPNPGDFLNLRMQSFKCAESYLAHI